MPFRLQRVPTENRALVLGARALAIVLSILTGTVILAFNGADLGALAGHMFKSIFLSSYGLQDLGLILTPLILTGLAVMIALRVGAWNIGAEGQFLAGALCTTGVGLFLDGPLFVMLPVMMVAGAIGGMLWILIPTLARAYVGVSELITTLLLNFVGLLLVYYFATGPWLDPSGLAFASTQKLSHQMPYLWEDIHWGLPFALLLTFAIALILNFSKWGFEVKISGSNPEAAKYAAIPFRKHLIIVMLLSGAIAGLAGAVEVAGTTHRLQGEISNNYGYIGIMVAVLARGSALGVIGGALLMATVLKAGIVLQTQGVTLNAVVALTGLILFLTAVADELSHYRIIRTGLGKSHGV